MDGIVGWGGGGGGRERERESEREREREREFGVLHKLTNAMLFHKSDEVCFLK